MLKWVKGLASEETVVPSRCRWGDQTRKFIIKEVDNGQTTTIKRLCTKSIFRPLALCLVYVSIRPISCVKYMNYDDRQRPETQRKIFDFKAVVFKINPS